MLLDNKCEIFSRSVSNKSAADLCNRDTYIAKMIMLKEKKYI